MESFNVPASGSTITENLFVFTNTGFRLDDDLLPIHIPIGRMST